MNQDDVGVWIRTEPTLDGKSFIVSLEVDQDHSVHLNRGRSIKHALAVLTAVEYACMDSVIWKQMMEKVGKEEVAARAIQDLRNDRPEIDFSVSAPMSLQPLCSADGKPFLYVLMDGKPVGQWEVEDARAHALSALSAFAIADLDSSYYRYLRGTIELEEEAARGTIADLVRFR